MVYALSPFKGILMANKLTVQKDITINAPANKVWKALTDPAMIKQYLFGTEAKSDWKKGSPISYIGEWEGKRYEDKGKIVDIVPEKLLHTTYLSGTSGKEDKQENYANVIYKLEPENGHTTVHLSQDNIEDEKGVKHMEENWGKVLEGMKKLLEK
jgi:uncharacterized protein YndB with AHSA1/START domain